MKNNNVPAIRFKGFTDAWEQRKLKEVANFINGRAYSQDELLASGKYKIVRVGNFYTNSDFYYSDLELGDKYYANKGDLLYTWSASFGPQIWEGEKVIYHYHIWKVELKKEADKFYIYYCLDREKERIIGDKNGSTMVHITKGGMESTVINCPPIEEQRLVGRVFKKLDNLITLHQSKLDKLQELKKALLQKLFPKNGSECPEVRFKGYVKPWSQCKLKDIVNIIGDGLHGTPEYCFGGHIFFINGNNLVDGKIVCTEETKTVSKLTQNQNVLIPDKTILMSINGTIGNLAWYSGEPVMLGKSVLYLSGIKANMEFVYHLLETPNIQKFFMDNLTGSTIKNLGLKTVRSTPIIISDEKEQGLVGKLIQSVTRIITLEKRELELLQETKKAFLQKLFV